MSPILSGGASAVSGSIPPLLIYDEVGDANGAITISPQGSTRNNGAASAFWGQILGAGHPWASPAAVGAMLGIRHRTSSGAGVGARSPFVDWRLGQRFSTNNPSLLVVRQRKFIFECAVAANGNGAEIAVKQDANTFATANTILGYGLQVAAGNWVGIRRLVTGAATQAVPVLQVLTAAVARRVRFEFTEGPVPVFECFMDDALMFSESGETNMPELTVPAATTYAPAVTSVAGVNIDTTAASLQMLYL